MQDMQLLTPKGVQEFGGDASFGGAPAATGGSSQGARTPAAAPAPDFDDEGDIPF
jgi:hypothetical protein